MCDRYLNTGDGRPFWGDSRLFEVMANCFEVTANWNSADHSRFPYILDKSKGEIDMGWCHAELNRLHKWEDWD